MISMDSVKHFLVWRLGNHHLGTLKDYVILYYLDEVSLFKYLGIVINNRLTWQDHVDQMFSKIKKKLGLLKRIRCKAAKIILDLPIGSSASVALNKLKRKTLARRRTEHRVTSTYKCLNNLFSHRFNIKFNKDKHD